ncbi:unnamed protein product [Toxocara canis]|uniref:FBXO47 ARM repeats region domain-containing protein n=1 Tax=Toxocara canis TaxID=6265 RepID=A0A3P7H2L8_TOXCA|nr:unnamed protein product [Toxocara canis]
MKTTCFLANFSRCSRVTLLKYFPANAFGVFARFSSETLLGVIGRIPVTLVIVYANPISRFVILVWKVKVTLLANLALTSRNFNYSLRRYAMSGSARKRFAKETDIAVVSTRASMTVEDPFYAWGRQAILVVQYNGHQEPKSFCAVNIDWRLARPEFKFAERWDFNECARLMRSLLATAENELYQAMCEVLEGEGGQHPISKMQFSLFSGESGVHFCESLQEVMRGFRELFLEHRYPDVRDSSFWMSAVLRTQFSASRQVKLMYVLFGPTKINDLLEEVVDWRGLCEQPISTSQNSRERLGPLSDAFFRLLQTKSIGASEFIYTETDVFNLLEEITTYPEPWLFDNFVALLLNRPALIPIAFVFRVVHGYQEEAVASCLYNLYSPVWYVFWSPQANYFQLLYRWHEPIVTYLAHPLRYTMRALSRMQRVVLLRSMLRAMYDAVFETFDNFPGYTQQYF